MNVLFFSRRFYPLIGGVEKHVLEIGKELVKKGHEVTVITEAFPNQGLKQEKDNVEGINIIRISAGKDDWFKKFRIWSQLWKLRNVIQDADIVHCHDVFFWYLPFRFLFPQKPIYTTFHGYETKFPPAKKAILVRKISEKLSWGNICVGKFIEKWYHTKADYITYGGINDIKSQKLNFKDIHKNVKIVFIGRVEKDTGVSVYLKALQKLKKEKRKFIFEAYGDGRLRQQIKNIGKVKGFTKDITGAIAAADIIFASSYLTMLESLAQKKVIIAVYENKLKEDYLKMSPFVHFTFIGKNVDEVVEVLKEIQKNPWKTNSMLVNGARWANEQTWEKLSRTYLKLWKIA